MKNQSKSFRAALAACLLTSIALATAVAAELSAEDQKFLAQYDEVRLALTADNLANAKKAAAEMGEPGAGLAASADLAAARKEFATLTTRALQIAEGHDEYYRVHCPMLKKEWVQKKTTIGNPYAGGTMPTCGMFKKWEKTPDKP